MSIIRSRPLPLCPVCNRGGEPVYSGLKDNLFFCTEQEWSMKACTSGDCRSLWLDPQPIPEDIGLAYKSYYTHGDKARNPLFRLAKFGYRGLVGLLLLPWQPSKSKSTAKYLTLADAKPGRILDVGCGDGSFLKLMRDRGWHCEGIDFDPKAVELANSKGDLNVRCGGIDVVAGNVQSYDVITLSHVIEHIYDPAEFISQCRSLLRDGGQLILRTPNLSSFGHRRFGASWRGLEVPRHLQLFTPDGMKRLANSREFSSVDVFTSAASAEYILVASHMLNRYGSFDGGYSNLWRRIEANLMGIFYSVAAARAFERDKNSGEELYAVLTR